MTIQRHNPAELSEPRGYSQVIVATGRRTVFVSGQVALDSRGNVVGTGDLGAQAKQAFQNVAAALKSVGAGPGDVAKMTWYVVNYSVEMLPALAAARRDAFGNHAPASTLIGVQALARPDFLIEIEVIAILD